MVMRRNGDLEGGEVCPAWFQPPEGGPPWRVPSVAGVDGDWKICPRAYPEGPRLLAVSFGCWGAELDDVFAVDGSGMVVDVNVAAGEQAAYYRRPVADGRAQPRAVGAPAKASQGCQRIGGRLATRCQVRVSARPCRSSAR